MSRKLSLRFVWFLLLLWSPWLEAAQESGKDGETQPEILTLQVRVTDPDGYPIENATVSPAGLRAKVERASHWQWDVDRLGPVPKVQTNAEGLIDLPYPKFVTEQIEVGTVTVSVSHPDFVVFREDRSVNDAPAEIQLKHGFRIAATAIDSATGEAIKQDLYGLVSGDPRMSDWKLSENGMLVSPVFESNKVWFRLMKLTPSEPALYSELIHVDPADRSRVLLRDVKLSRGSRVTGRLDDTIPRPIRNGFVVARIVRSGSGDDRFRGSSKWYWSDHTPIDEDGTFVFESLPPDEILQMIPICDGWFPKNPSKGAALTFFPTEADRISNRATWSQLTRLDGALVEPVLKMVPATKVRVTVLDQDNRPLPGALVSSWPEQAWFEGGGNLLGTAYSTAEALVNIRHGGLPTLRANRFTATTDEHGIAILHSMPANVTEGMDATLDGYEMPLDDGERKIAIHLKPDIINEVTIRLQPAGTEVRGDNVLKGNENDD